MNIIFLGTGPSPGVPTVCCQCEICLSDDPRNKRLRSSILVQNDGSNILIDTSTDLRQQCLDHNITHIHSVLYTHHHADHVHGIDELRSFNFFNKMVIPCYGSEQTLSVIKNSFNYIFNGNNHNIGGGTPRLTLQTIDNEPFVCAGVSVTPLDVMHGNMVITAYKLNNAAYVTDCSHIPEESKAELEGLDLLILNALGFKPHPTHFSLGQALEAVEELKPKRTILTHLNHQFDHQTVSKELPEGVELAYDGLRIEV